MHLGALLPQVGDVDSATLAVRAEEWGYDSVWVSELWGKSAVVALTEIACRTERVELGTAIANVFSRSPATLAMTARSLHDVSGGRFTLGVGTSTPKAIEDLHGMRFSTPVRRAHEAISLIKRFTSGEEKAVSYDGEVFCVADFPPLDADVPVYHAALGPANRRVVGRLCDGWIPHNVPFPDLADAFEEIEESARKVGRDPDAITVAPYVPAAVSDDPTEAEAAIRGHVAYYVGSGEGYRRAVGSRFPDRAEAIAAAWQSGDRAEATRLVGDEMVAALGVCGATEEARAQLEALVEGSIVDRPVVVVPQQAAADLGERTLEALAPLGRVTDPSE